VGTGRGPDRGSSGLAIVAGLEECSRDVSAFPVSLDSSMESLEEPESPPGEKPLYPFPDVQPPPPPPHLQALHVIVLAFRDLVANHLGKAASLLGST